MAYRYRDPLAQTRREHNAERMKRKRESMSVAQVEAAMRKVVRTKLAQDGAEAVITLDDFKLANLPMQLVAPMAVPLVRAEISLWLDGI